MSTDALQRKYAPILRFSRGERFFPMSVDDYLSYSALYTKGQRRARIDRGHVRLDDLKRGRRGAETFLRSVAHGPLLGIELASQWSQDALELLYRWSRSPAQWTVAAARAAYSWFSPRTEAATKMFWWNDLLLDKAQSDAKSDKPPKLPRFILPGEARHSAIQHYQESQQPRPNYTYYYRWLPQGTYLNLQYWFFYAYNDWAGGYGGFNDHEGDWEGFQLFFRLDGQRPVEPPAYACYLGHHSRITKPWDHPDMERSGTHPVVNVAAGSHASYPERKQYPLMALYNLIDYATGDALTLDHDQWTSRVNLTSQPWLDGYRGSWGTRYWLPLQWLRLALGSVRALLPGDISLPGVSAPRGPRYDDHGAVRQTWDNTLEFAGIE